MATINFEYLDSLLDSGEFYKESRTTQTVLKILKYVNNLGFDDCVEARKIATDLTINENTVRQYSRWLGRRGLVWVINKNQGGVMHVKSVNSPW